MAQVPERGVRDVRDSWGVEALFGGFDKPEQVHSRLVIPPKVAQSNYGYGGGPNGGINPLELSWDEQRFLAQLASDRKMVSDRARAHELSARASTGVRAGGVPSFVDVASPSKPVVTRGVRDAASAEFARPSSAATWHERERAAVRARGATSSTASPSSSRPRPATASNHRFGGPVPSASPVRPALKHRSNTSSPYKSPAKRSVQWEPGVTDAGIVTDHPSVGGQSPVPMRTKKSYLHAENNELELEAGPTSRRNLKFGGPGGGGGAPGGPRASWPGPKNGGVETLSQVKTRIHGSNHLRTDVDETRLSKDERQFLDAMGSHRVMVSDRARLAASVAELGLLPTGDAPITTQPGAGYKTRPGGVARPNTGSAAGGPKQVSAVDYANSGAPIAPVRASWNPDASPSREEAAFDPAKSLRQSLTSLRPRTSPAATKIHRDENDDPTDYPYDAAAAAGTHDPNPWADRNASLRAAVRNRLRPSSARSQVSSLGDLEQLEQTVEALRKSYRRADPPARGRGASARLVTMSVDGLGGLDAERVVKIAEREARDWEWQSSWQWEWQQELDVETRGRRRPATAAPTTTRRQQQQPQQVPAKVQPSPVKSPVKSPMTASATSTPTKTNLNFTPGLKPSSAVNTPVMKSPAPSARKPPRSPAFVKSPAAVTRSPFREPIVAAKPVSPAPASPVRREPEPEPTPKVVEASSVVEEDPEPSVRFGRRARASGMHASPAAAMPSPTLPSPPTLKETSPSPSPEKGTYAERREAYRGSKGAAAAETPSPSPRRSTSPAFVRRLSDASIGEDIETLPDELSSAGDDSDIEVVELMEVDAGFGGEEAIWKPASSKYV